MSMRTIGMKTQSLQRDDPCSDCQIRKAAEQEMKQTKKVAQPRLADWRYACANCQNIYKFDLLMQYWKAKAKLPPGKGKSCTIPEGVRQKILEHRKAGMSMQKIVDMVGVSLSQVRYVIEKDKEKQ